VNSWTVFATLWTSFNAPFQAAVNAESTQLATAVATPAMLAATIFLAITATLDLMSGGGGNPVLDIVRRTARIALILAAIGAATYVGTVNNLLLTTLPNELAQAVAGGKAVGAGAFDTLAGQAWASCEQVWKNIAWDDPPSWLAAFWAFLYLVNAMLAISVCFALWAITQVGLGLVVAVGPLAITCLINPQTARFFNGWLSTVVTFIIAQVMYVTLMSLLLVSIGNILTDVVRNAAAGGSNVNNLPGEVHSLLNAGLIFDVGVVLALTIVPIARAIGGGAAHEAAPLARWASGRLGAVDAASSVRPAGQSAAIGGGLTPGGAAGMRSITPAGRAA
jgi:type IV secretion system protein VirB6